MSIPTPTSVITLPFAVRRRGGRKEIVTPDGAQTVAQPYPRADNTVVKLLARAFRWRRLLETGRYQTVEEIAQSEKINSSYVSRVLRLTLLAPDIVEGILADRADAEVPSKTVLQPFPVEWERQLDFIFNNGEHHA